MNIEQVNKLCKDSMEEYNSGYEKAYKNIPDLVHIIEKMLPAVVAAQDVRGYILVHNREYIILYKSLEDFNNSGIYK